MSKDRTVMMGGRSFALGGNEVKVGDKAPDFEVIGIDLKPKQLSDFAGKICVISTILSVDTGVCDKETRKFNELASKLGDNVEILTVSVDLPFTQKRWCGAAGIDRVTMLSDHKAISFGNNYGVIVDVLRTLARCVFIIDSTGIIRYIQLSPEIGQEPDYDDVVKAIKTIV